MNFTLITDSVCDLSGDFAKSYDINVIPMQFSIEDKSYFHYSDCREMPLNVFYEKIKNGAVAKTTQINIDQYTDFFTPFLEDGKDILYICFTTGLSGSYNSCMIAVNDLKEQFPDRKIYVVDSACASVGHGNLAYKTALYIKQGHNLEEARTYAEEIKKTINHWFVVDDLDCLKRGGRLSSAAATFGKALGIKPLLSVDDDGKLLTVAKIRGALKAYDALVDRLVEYGEDLKEQTVFIGYTYNKENAEKLKRMVAPLVKEVEITELGPIIGAHVGINMLALSFSGKRIYK